MKEKPTLTQNKMQYNNVKEIIKVKAHKKPCLLNIKLKTTWKGKYQSTKITNKGKGK
jgi:hypothetical protein